MANENINILNSNVCNGPQIGTFCTVDTSGSNNKLQIKTNSGVLVNEYSLSYTIIDELIDVEYVGPVDTFVIDDTVFFTLERASDSRCVIRRWRLNNSTSVLDLEDVIVKTNIGSLYYDASGMSVEYYHRELTDNVVYGQNYIDINNASKLKTGMKVFVGPSTDADNRYKTEELTVNNVVGNRVYFNTFFRYEYNIGNKACFYTNIYLFSNKDLLGTSSEGTLFTINPYTGNVSNFRTSGYYLGITGCRWNTLFNNITIIAGKNNLIFIDPYDYYEVKKSLFLDNLYANDIDTYDIDDIVFNTYSVYKLSNKTTLVDDEGNKTIEDWLDYYNLVPDSILPYTNKVCLKTSDNTLVGSGRTVNIVVKVTDQFGVGLRDVQVDFSVISGDTGGEFTPLDGRITTDSNGYGVIEYTSGNSYDGITRIGARASGGLPSSGSEYVWGFFEVINNLNITDKTIRLYQKEDPLSVQAIVIRQLDNNYFTNKLMFCKSFFTSPGGDWEYNSPYNSQVVDILGMTEREGLNDGPTESLTLDSPFNEYTGNISNRISQILDFESDKYIKQPKYFVNFAVDGQIEENKPKLNVKQLDSNTNTASISQLNHSRHSIWVDDNYSDVLYEDINVDQFVFVEDAIPKFFSYKNDRDTNIWVRLRPFAFSLDPSTLVFKIKTLSYEGETEYVDVTSEGTITVFDAGAGIQGIEFLYNPPEDFNNNSMVYIIIEIYDQAPIPNRIIVNYWFNIIGDYRAPYLYNLNPDRNQMTVPIDTDIYFEIKDDDVGIDIDSLEVFVNYLSIVPNTITKINDKHYAISYTPSDNFRFNRQITISVKINDLSDNNNTLYDSYVFYTSESEEVSMDLFNPDICERGVSVKSDISFVVLDYGNGIDSNSIELEVDNKDVTTRISKVPIIYRIS